MNGLNVLLGLILVAGVLSVIVMLWLSENQ